MDVEKETSAQKARRSINLNIVHCPPKADASAAIALSSKALSRQHHRR
ncbi:MAG: hypothetical protein ABFD46_00765 [Armatimonadota bacterium]